MDQTQSKHDVFLSHSSEDKRWADAACSVLEKHGIRCWVAPRDIIPGEEWGASIIRGISSSRIMVLVFSDHANNSGQVRREVERAISRSMPLLPVRIENVSPTGALEFALSNTHWLDAFTPPVEQQLETLAKSVKALLGINSAVFSPTITPAEPLSSPKEVADQAVPSYEPHRPPRPDRVESRPPVLAILLVILAILVTPIFLILNSGEPGPPQPPIVGVTPVPIDVTSAAPKPVQPPTVMPSIPATAVIDIPKTPSTEPKSLAKPADNLTPAPPPTAHEDKSITNSIGMKFVPIPAGTFRMGSPDSDLDAQQDEKPQHLVNVSDFYLGATEVTRGQFARFVKETGYKTEAEKSGGGGFGWNAAEGKLESGRKYSWQFTGFDQTDEHAVVNVTWNDAVAFADWLSKREARNYRLPTEAEWEYACRAGSTTRYQFGDKPDGLVNVANVSDASRKTLFPKAKRVDVSDGFVFTSPVGHYRPNAWGLFDMHGNVWEWCADGYSAYTADFVVDPRGPDIAPGRIIRGGGWDDPESLIRSATRFSRSPDVRDNDLGFRLVRTWLVTR